MAYEIENSDTPIFDQLAREKDYKRLITRLPIDLRPAWTGQSTHIRGFMAPGAYIDEWAGIDTTQDNALPITYDEVVRTIARVQTDETVNAAPSTDEDGEDVIVFGKPIPVTTLADLAKGQQQE